MTRRDEERLQDIVDAVAAIRAHLVLHDLEPLVHAVRQLLDRGDH